MGGSQAISATDSLRFNPYMNYDSLACDSYFQKAAMAYNSNFRASEQTDSTSESQGAGQTTQTEETYQSNSGSSVGGGVLQASEQSESSITPYVVSGTIIAGGIAGLIYAGKRGNGEGIIAGLKNIWNGLFKKEGKAALENAENLSIARTIGKNVKNFTVMKDGMQVVFRNGVPVKICTKEGGIKTGKALEKWINKNPQAVKDVADYHANHIPAISSGNALPDGVALSWERELTVGGVKHRFVTENGVVTKVFRDGKGGIKELEGKELEGFKNNHKHEIKEAETLQKTVELTDVRLPDGKKNKPKFIKPKGEKTNVTLQVRNGKVTGASYVNDAGQTVQLKGQQLRLIQNDFAKEIKKFGQEPASRYTFSDGSAVTDFSYARNFNVNGVKTKIRFNPDGEIIGIDRIIKEQTIGNGKKGSDAINKFIEDNGLTEEIEAMKSGQLPEGYITAERVIKSENGNIFTLNGNNVVKEVELKNGTKLSGNALNNWKNKAENRNELETTIGTITE